MGEGLAYRVTGSDPENRYRYVKEIIADPHLPCLLQRTRVEGSPEVLQKLKIYALLAPHLDIAGGGNSGYVMRAINREILVAERNGCWLAMMANRPFNRVSVGYVGQSDGWTDLADGFRMDWEFDCATNGNVALIGEIDLAETQEFTLGVAFGDSLHSAMTALFQSVVEPFDEQAARFEEQWKRTDRTRRPLENFSFDEGRLYRTSYRLLLAHEDKTFPGAMVASMAIPWGDAKSDEAGQAGYHLVWTRDMVQSALALVAAGNTETPFRALVYLATNQQADGGFAQNFWIRGEPFWTGIQLDEVSFPILLAHRLKAEGALRQIRPLAVVMRGAAYLIQHGPVSQQERWEELSGYSPSTLAAEIAALICAADFAHENDDEESAVFFEQYADWIEHNLENWTVTREGSLVEGVSEYFVRVNPACAGDYLPENGVHDETVHLTSRYPNEQAYFPARDIVDGGFLELVRYGVRRPDDPIILNTVKVIDAMLEVDLPAGKCWKRYNNDGYGQRDGGDHYDSYGRGRPWPLLTGERGHYEVAAGRDPADYVRWMEGLATTTRMLPEQVWDEDDIPEKGLRKGGPTGSAAPLLWAHAEYIKLLRSRADGQVFDRIPSVANRYSGEHPPYANLHFWSFACPARSVGRGQKLRIIADAQFRLRWSGDNWQNTSDPDASATKFGIFYADLEAGSDTRSLRFTFFWPEAARWEGKDFEVTVV